MTMQQDVLSVVANYVTDQQLGQPAESTFFFLFLWNRKERIFFYFFFTLVFKQKSLLNCPLFDSLELLITLLDS